MKKPISPTAHGIIDYIFAASQLVLPSLLKTNRNARLTEGASGAAVLAYTLLTASPVGLKKLIPFKVHRIIDISALAGLGLLSFAGMYRKDRKAMWFHAALLAAGIAAVSLTDWEAGDR